MLRTDIWTAEGHTDGWSGPTPRPAFAKAKQFIIPGNPEIFFHIYYRSRDAEGYMDRTRNSFL